MKYCLIISSLLYCFAQARAQAPTGFKLSGKVVNDKSEGIEEEGVFLFNGVDTSLVKAEFTDQRGNFEFSALQAGEYILSIKNTNYISVFQKLTISADLLLQPIQLQLRKMEIEELTVTQKRPYLERGAGRFSINVEGSIQSTGSSAFEVIEKAPGVIISSTDEIRLSGRGGIQVQINGKRLPMAGSELANYLRGISSAAIDKIEFITNPGASQDAAGSAIINIKLKKDMRFGTNGVVAQSYGQGVYAKTGTGLSLNHRTAKWNVYGSHNYAYRKAFNHLVLERNFYDNDTFRGAYIQDNYLVFPFRNHISRVGIDYTPNQRHNFSLVANGVINRFNPTGKNVSDVIGPDQQPVSSYETTNNSADQWYNGSVNLNYTQVLDSLGSYWATDADYARYGNKTEQHFETNFYDLNKQLLQNPYLLYGDLKGDLFISALKTDYSKHFKNGNKLELGGKSSYVQADNNLQFFDQSAGNSVYDSTKSNHFIYTEQIHALYLNMNQHYKKWDLVYGVRSELTRVRGEQLVYDQLNDTSYIQLFPSVSLSYQASAKHRFDFNLSRRIDRPSYDQLNPFKFYLDPSTYKEGNPYLGPQTTYALELGHLFKEKYYTMIGLSQTNNNLTEVIAPLVPGTNITVQTIRNLSSTQVAFLNISLPFSTKKWTSQTDLNAYYANYSGNVANTQLNKVSTWAFNINTVHTYQLGKSTSFEFTGNYRTREVYAYDSINRIWTIGLGVQQRVFKNNGSLKLAVTDLCYTGKISANVHYAGYHEYFLVRRETRVTTLSFTYRFGNKQVAQARRRAGGAEDLKRRVNSQGNG